ncbi:hypothetical protein GCM10027289_30900 [Tsukamurella serpentis]
MRTRSGGAVLLACSAVLLAGCSATVSGNPEMGVTVVPGGVQVTTVPPAPSASAFPPGGGSAPPAPSSTETSSATPTAGSPVAIEDNGNGYTFMQTRSGKARCRVSETGAGCQLQFAQPVPRTESGDGANGVNVGSDGVLTYVLGDIGVADPVTLDYRTYTARGWTIVATEEATTFTNQRTGHGMIVNIYGARAF